MDCFLYDNGLRLERVNIRSEIWQPLNIKSGHFRSYLLLQWGCQFILVLPFLRYHFQLGKMDSLEHFETSS